jgi:hypothetical protein
MYDTTWPPAVPATNTTQEIMGPLVEAIKAHSHGHTVVRVLMIHYAKDRGGAWKHNPWLLWFMEHNGHTLTSKIPLWVFERCTLKGPAPTWHVVLPAQGELF